MRLEGSLDGFGLPDVIALLATTRKSGALHLTRAARESRSVHGVLFFADGFLVAGDADCSRAALARRVAGTVVIEQAALTAAVTVASMHGGLLPTLLAAGVIDEDCLARTVTDHLLDTVVELLRWAEGDFAFDVAETSTEETAVRLDAATVVTTARDRLAAWEVASEQIDRTVPLALLPAAFATPGLSAEDTELLSLLDGHSSADDLTAMTGRGRFEILAALAALRERGFLEPVGPSSHSEARRHRQELAARLEPDRGRTVSASVGQPSYQLVPRQLPGGPPPSRRVDDASVPTWFSASGPGLSDTRFLPVGALPDSPSGIESLPLSASPAETPAIELDAAVAKSLVIRLTQVAS